MLRVCCALPGTAQGTEDKAPASWGRDQAEFPVEDIERGERGSNQRGCAVDRCGQGLGLEDLNRIVSAWTTLSW